MFSLGTIQIHKGTTASKHKLNAKLRKNGCRVAQLLVCENPSQANAPFYACGSTCVQVNPGIMFCNAHATPRHATPTDNSNSP